MRFGSSLSAIGQPSTSLRLPHMRSLAAIALLISAFITACSQGPDVDLQTENILVRPAGIASADSTEYVGDELDGASVAGVIEVFVRPAGWIREVHYSVDNGFVTFVATEAPFAFVLDTTGLSDGSHKLTLTPRLANGRPKGGLDVSFNVANDTGDGGGGDGEGDGGDQGGGGDEEQPNRAPTITLEGPAEAVIDVPTILKANVYDDGLPNKTLSVRWSLVSGPKDVEFSSPNAAITSATFQALGSYVLRASVTDGELSAAADLEVSVQEPDGEPDQPDDPLDGDFDPPIKITKGGVYTGRWASDDPDVPAVLIDTAEPVTIENSVLTGPGHLISTDFHKTTRLVVRNSQGFGQNPDVYGENPGRFIHVESFADLVVENNYLEGTSGIYVHRWLGGGSVKIRFNRARNIVGLWSDGNGSWLDGGNQFTYAQFVQFNDVRGVSGAEISWNEVVNVARESRTEDVISMYKSGGTTSSPIRIHDNFIRGSYPAKPESHSFSGGGILLGDHGGDNQVAYQNQIVNVANYGVAIAGGVNNRLESNRIVSSGALEDGTRIHAANVGIYIWNQTDHPFGSSAGTENVVGYVQLKTDGTPVRNDWWIPDASTWTGNTKLAGPITAATEDAEFEAWQTKYTQAGVSIGLN